MALLHLCWDVYGAAPITLATCHTIACAKPRQVEAWAAPAIDSTNVWVAALCPAICPTCQYVQWTVLTRLSKCQGAASRQEYLGLCPQKTLRANVTTHGLQPQWIKQMYGLLCCASKLYYLIICPMDCARNKCKMPMRFMGCARNNF